LNPSFLCQIKTLLRQQPRHCQDLIDRLPDRFEVQLNVRQAGGESVNGDGRAPFKNDNYKWFPLRYPRDAGSSPQWNDELSLPFPLELFADRIGVTGFGPDGSFALGFDFDGPGHKGGNTAEQIQTLAEAASQIPWVEVRRSTSDGLHLYVWLANGFDTKNHNEHALLAECVWETRLRPALAELCDVPKIDKKGGVMWIWRHTN
jgi:hypothetical protein